MVGRCGGVYLEAFGELNFTSERRTLLCLILRKIFSEKNSEISLGGSTKTITTNFDLHN